jgi:hypothetical protein
MKKNFLSIILFFPLLLNAQTFKNWRVQSNFFLGNVVLDKTATITTPWSNSTTVTPKLGYGVEGTTPINLSNKLNLLVGIGCDFRNFATRLIGPSWASDFDPTTGNVRKSTTIIETTNQFSAYMPLELVYNLNEKNALILGANTYFRFNSKYNILLEYEDGSAKIDGGDAQQNFRKIGVSTRIGYCFRRKLSDNTVLLINPNANIFLTTDALYLGNSNNRFWDVGLSIGIEFGKTVEKTKPKKIKRRGQ